jgi:pimeloyl-ACP methyl ester carboxylesterase
MYLTEEQVLAFLTAIQAPTFLVRGESGYLLKREFMAKRYRQVANLTVQALSGGHHLHLENPEPVACALNGFFET